MFVGQENKLSLDELCFFDAFIHEIFIHQFIIDFVLYSGDTIKNKKIMFLPSRHNLW